MGRYKNIMNDNKNRKWKPARVVSTDNPVLTKLLKLKYRINDAYAKYSGDGLNTK